MTPLDEIEALLGGVAMADARAFRKLYARTAPYFWAALRQKGAANPEERLESGYASIWETAGELRQEADGALWMARHMGLVSPQAQGISGTVSVLEDLQTLHAKDPPPQILHRLESRLFGRRRAPVWKQLLPYVVGAVLAALLAWAGMRAGIVTPI